jgi:hypothetical protein
LVQKRMVEPPDWTSQQTLPPPNWLQSALVLHGKNGVPPGQLVSSWHSHGATQPGIAQHTVLPCAWLQF